MVYVPAGVPGAMVIVPLAFKVKPVGTVTPVKVTCDGFTVAPFKVSLANTLAVVAPVLPLIGPKVSATASITAGATVIVVVTVSQFVGLSTSQIL